MDDMKKLLNATALLLLIFSAISQATDISQLPVDSLGTVKPNIIIAYDDSGSMNWDFLPDVACPKGGSAFGSSPCDSGGSGYSASNGLSIQQYSSYNYNPLAYIPLSARTYKPWVKSVVAGTTYPNASITAYTSPATITSGTLSAFSSYKVTYSNCASSYSSYYDFTNNAKFTSTATCTARNGSVLTVPKAGYAVLSGQSWQLTAAYYQIQPYTLTPDTISTWPAIACPSTVTAAGTVADLCSGIPSGTTATLAGHYALTLVAIPTTNTAELQNYANWKQYENTRQKMVAFSMSSILPNISGIYMGVNLFNESSVTNSSVTKKIDSTVTTTNTYSGISLFANSGKMFNLDWTADKDTLLDIIYNVVPGSGTPTHQKLIDVGTTFGNANLVLTEHQDDGTYPSVTRKGIIQYSCQKNASFLVTDGYANGSPLPTVPSYSQTTWGAAKPYSTTYSKSMADIALAYYTINPRTDLALGKVPADTYTTGSSADSNTNLHMNSYGLTLGVTGNQFGTATYPQATATAAAYTTPPTWVDPTTSTALNTMVEIDDLWHATLNGRGQMFSAANSTDVVTSVTNAFMDIILRAGSQSAIAVANVNMTQTNDFAYGSSYNATGWFGDVQEFLVNLTTGAVNNTNPVWSARDKLDAMAYTGRNIFTINNVVFGAAAPLPTLPTGSATGATVATLVNYLKGDRSNEANGNNTNQYYRVRPHLMGDAVNAEPLIANNIVYQATNDGMLHAFSAADGSEKWAYVPSQNIPNLGNLSLTTYNHQYFVDSTPIAGKYNATSTLLVGGLGAGKFGYYAIDVTTPATPLAKWEFPNNNIGTLGNDTKNGGTTSINKPRLIHTNDLTYPYVVVISSGYNNGTGIGNSGGDGKGHIWLVNPANGNVLRDMPTPDGIPTAPVGLSTFAAFVANATTNNTVSYLYGGDELGNVWKIDATPTSIFSWTLSKFAAVGRPITVKPELTSTTLGNPIVLFGTGRLFGTTDIVNADTQGFYAIQDMQVTSAPTITTPMLTSLTASGGDATSRTLTPTIPIDTNHPCPKWNDPTYYGWHFDFPQGGERVVGDPKVGIGHVAFNTNLMSANSCSSASYSYWLSLNVGDSNSCSLPIDTGSNMGKYLGGFTASRPVLVSLPNGKIELLTHQGNGTILNTDTGNFNLVTSAIRSWRSLKRPMR
jgi:type IV pilus assembly protein PilY1